ncbi:SPOR domain-containing protein [Ruegeria marina]|uniref:Sporulation related domain-containing protein n=1 Tax=Ruegeria marina TaxID=639004 RepID=A0A1G6JS19_9RHOB|nr:SPOR domain-containing protein [Ruegeria marina]SDC21539.1 Sporulation related domain-containing protein [Ruegeria marina]
MASFDYTGHVNPNQVHYSYNMPEFEVPEDSLAEDQQGEFEKQAPRPGLGRIVSLMGAVGSLALVVGIGIWGYKLVMRDVSGVPVVRALEGPMRIQPDNPGGLPADHQGLAVNTVAAQGTAAPPADRLLLAPQPVSLSDEDVPMNEVTPTTVSLSVSAEVPSEAVEAFRNGQIDQLVAELTGGAGQLADKENALLEEESTELASIEQPTPLTAIDPADLAQANAGNVLAGEPGVRRSLRPLARPGRSVPSDGAAETATKAAINTALGTAMAVDLDPDSLPVGTRLAQLGAYDTPEIAQAEWDRLYGRFSEYMDGKQRVIEGASSGGRTFYRLRVAGFDDLSEARHFCSVLVAERADCIPVTTK